MEPMKTKTAPARFGDLQRHQLGRGQDLGPGDRDVIPEGMTILVGRPKFGKSLVVPVLRIAVDTLLGVYASLSGMSARPGPRQHFPVVSWPPVDSWDQIWRRRGEMFVALGVSSGF